MTMEGIRADMAAKAAGIDPSAKTLAFHLDDDILLIDRIGDTNVASIAAGQEITPERSAELDWHGRLPRGHAVHALAAGRGDARRPAGRGPRPVTAAGASATTPV